ncbi:hypothetical protein PIB30_026145 [Stylosanthes scabra]|uniref:Uncharacterized protein n=1 Tax=Stylosanthes scabra TaxID=79078 RepID=A0ABU6UC50_9FABA|nr:hypothetical protein [Stylosanthes scabra]
MSIDLKLSRFNRIYRPSEALEGKIIIKTHSSISHYGIRLALKGSVNLQVRGGSAGVVESFYGVIKPIPILNRTIEVKPSGKIASGITEIPFSVTLRQREENLEKFYETFHGANISIQYLVTVDVTRGYLHKSLSTTMEFIIESDKGIGSFQPIVVVFIHGIRSFQPVVLYQYFLCAWIISDDLLQRPIPPEMVIFYITQDTQRHPLLPELKSGVLFFHLRVDFG